MCSSDLGKTESWNGSAWTETGDLNVARYDQAGSGSQTAAITAAGYRTDSPAGNTTFVEQWNGSAWTEVADVNTAV